MKAKKEEKMKTENLKASSRAAKSNAKSTAFVLAISTALLCMSGCATVTDDAFRREQAVQNSEQRLAQRGRELVRARGDLTHFRTTLRHLRDHESRWSRSTFDSFMVRFLEERVDPLISNDWQSGNPQLSQLDVDLRLLRAEALLDLGMKRDVARAIREISRNYKGQEQMLVTNSRGEGATLKESLDGLRRRLKRS